MCLLVAMLIDKSNSMSMTGRKYASHGPWLLQYWQNPGGYWKQYLTSDYEMMKFPCYRRLHYP